MAYDDMNGEEMATVRSSGGPTLENALNDLDNIDGSIRELLGRRREVLGYINEMSEQNRARVNASTDWFEGEVMGRPIPDRGGEVPHHSTGPYDEPSIARRY